MLDELEAKPWKGYANRHDYPVDVLLDLFWWATHKMKDEDKRIARIRGWMAAKDLDLLNNVAAPLVAALQANKHISEGARLL